MEYKFVETIQGPAVVGEDEVLFFSQFGPLLDYVDSDPEFLGKAKMFVSEGLVSAATDIATSLSTAVVGDRTQAVYGYLNAVTQLKQFEFNYLPSVNKN